MDCEERFSQLSFQFFKQYQKDSKSTSAVPVLPVVDLSREGPLKLSKEKERRIRSAPASPPNCDDRRCLICYKHLPINKLTSYKIMDAKTLTSFLKIITPSKQSLGEVDLKRVSKRGQYLCIYCGEASEYLLEMFSALLELEEKIFVMKAKFLSTVKLSMKIAEEGQLNIEEGTLENLESLETIPVDWLRQCLIKSYHTSHEDSGENLEQSSKIRKKIPSRIEKSSEPTHLNKINYAKQDAKNETKLGTVTPNPVESSKEKSEIHPMEGDGDSISQNIKGHQGNETTPTLVLVDWSQSTLHSDQTPGIPEVLNEEDSTIFEDHISDGMEDDSFEIPAESNVSDLNDVEGISLPTPQLSMSANESTFEQSRPETESALKKITQRNISRSRGHQKGRKLTMRGRKKTKTPVFLNFIANLQKECRERRKVKQEQACMLCRMQVASQEKEDDHDTEKSTNVNAQSTDPDPASQRNQAIVSLEVEDITTTTDFSNVNLVLFPESQRQSLLKILDLSYIELRSKFPQLKRREVDKIRSGLVSAKREMCKQVRTFCNKHRKRFPKWKREVPLKFFDPREEEIRHIRIHQQVTYNEARSIIREQRLKELKVSENGYPARGNIGGPGRVQALKKIVGDKIFYRNVEVVKTEDGNFKCGTCGEDSYIYTNNQSVYGHINKHHNDLSNAHNCEHCGKKFYQYSGLEEHVRVKHYKERLQCHLCGETFANRSGKHHHTKIVHEGHRPHTCEHCGKSFGTRKDMTIHVRRHTGERPFVCHICAATFIDKQTMKKHIKMKHPDAMDAPESSVVEK